MSVGLLLLGVAAAFAAPPTEHYRVPMTDGTELATDVYLPDTGDGPWPAILVRSVYGRLFPVRGLVEDSWARSNYAVVVQDVRGMGTSEGDTDIFFADGWRDHMHDGADTVDWLHEQSWCNGKVGSWGASGLGMTGMLLAPSTDDVDVQYIGKAPASFYHHALYHGGVLRENMVFAWLTGVFQPEILPTYKARPVYGEFWKHYNTLAQTEKITAPAFFYGSWYDIFQQGILDAFVAREKQGGPGARGENYLIMGAGTHNRVPTPDYTWRDDGSPSSTRLRRALFDCHLRGMCDALEGVPKVQYFVLGADTPKDAPGNEWRTAQSWPPFKTTPAPFYLQPGGGLAREKAQNHESAGYAFDPENPYPTYGGANLFYNVRTGPFDQREYSESRDDLLKFATAPLKKPLEVTGRVTVRLYVSTDAPDTDFTAKLVDIYPEPDGREINILDGIRRLKLRDALDQVAPYTPGDIVPVEIDLWSTSIVFAPGHRIGLHISSSNAPRFAVNPNTGADFLEEEGETRVAHNQVHFGKDYPSALILPVPREGERSPES
ncbi:MAG: CocE/NonD family hydrolase [Candidatus Hydrogenedentota bacterium]